MLTVANARAKITNAMERTASIEVSVSDVFGRVLAEELKSRRTQPPFDVSAMDGTQYAQVMSLLYLPL